MGNGMCCLVHETCTIYIAMIEHKMWFVQTGFKFNFPNIIWSENNFRISMNGSQGKQSLSLEIHRCDQKEGPGENEYLEYIVQFEFEFTFSNLKI